MRLDGVGAGTFEARGRIPGISARSVGWLALAGSTAIFLWYLVAHVPVTAPRLAGGDLGRHWQTAVTAALVVGAFAAFVTVSVRPRRQPGSPADHDRARGDFTWLPQPLRFQRVPRPALIVAASVSAGFAVLAGLSRQPGWLIGAAILLLWIPLLAWELASKFQHYGLYAAFVAIVLFQLLHMIEHTVQVLQLVATHGDLERSHGVFGQLDFELVHFISVTGLWLCLAFLLHVFGAGNRWLWIAFAAACLHEVEHVYLFWLYLGHREFYDAGGFAGIMALGGVIGSPLAREYLHFTYNLLVLVPMGVALWDASQRVGDRFFATSAPYPSGPQPQALPRADRATAAQAYPNSAPDGSRR